jgi:AbrB family looped-hinge helix DNA binding protein
MTMLVRIHRKGQMTLPSRLRSAIGITDGDLVEATVHRGKILLLEKDLRHSSLHAKKYDESRDRWQARVNRDWRFYFNIVGDTYVIRDIVSHPK